VRLHASGTRRNGEALPPFLGVPIVLKEAFEYPGMPYTQGLVARRWEVGKRKGPVVRRVEEAGFIVLGFGNLSEATMWMESYNPVYGRSLNPYDLARTPGGSSGGTAAAVAVMAVPVGITSDIGGSTRIPAFYCGLFGHKPTGGLIANTGTHLDNFHGAICRICQTGMVTRHAEDLLPMLRMLVGPPLPEEDAMVAEYLPLPEWHGKGVDFSRLSVTMVTWRDGILGSLLNVLRGESSKRSLPALLLSSVPDALLVAQARAVDWLEAQGCKIRRLYFEDLLVGDWFQTWSTRVQNAGGPSFREVICQSKQTFGPMELLRYVLGASKHTLPALSLAFIEDLITLFEPPLTERLAIAQDVEDTLSAAISDYGILVMPTLPVHGLKHDMPLLRFLDSCFTSIWNATEFPATAVPLGLDTRGLPLGVQLVSRRGNDELTIACARALADAGVARHVPPGCGQ